MSVKNKILSALITSDLKFHIFRDKQSMWRWHLTASNGRIIANCGEGYVNRPDCEHAMKLVKESAGAETVED